MSMWRALAALLLLALTKQPVSFVNPLTKETGCFVRPPDGTTIGWRGDGSGRYPAATPPTTWGRVSKAIQGLRMKASNPADSDRAEPLAAGVIRPWLGPS